MNVNDLLLWNPLLTSNANADADVTCEESFVHM